MAGCLYGIGVGPGAPDLISLRAVKLLNTIDIVLAAASQANEYSLALEIARPHLNRQAEVKRLDFPMTTDKNALEKAWGAAALTCQVILSEGKNAAFLTLGDPLIYSTFGYLLKALKKIQPDADIQAIPGITAFQAAAAQAGVTLCEGRQSLTILAGIAPEAELTQALKRNDPAVILKIYRNFQAVAAALQNTGRGENCILASFVEQPNQAISTGTPEQKPPYMSLIISKQAD